MVPSVILKDKDVLTPQDGSLRTEKFDERGPVVSEALIVVDVVVVVVVVVVDDVVKGVGSFVLDSIFLIFGFIAIVVDSVMG